MSDHDEATIRVKVEKALDTFEAAIDATQELGTVLFTKREREAFQDGFAQVASAWARLSARLQIEGQGYGIFERFTGKTPDEVPDIADAVKDVRDLLAERGGESSQVSQPRDQRRTQISHTTPAAQKKLLDQIKVYSKEYDPILKPKEQNDGGDAQC